MAIAQRNARRVCVVPLRRSRQKREYARGAITALPRRADTARVLMNVDISASRRLQFARRGMRLPLRQARDSAKCFFSKRYFPTRRARVTRQPTYTPL